MDGWLFDLHLGQPGELILWLKHRNGAVTRLPDHWRPSLYVAASSRADLHPLPHHPDIQPLLHHATFVNRRETPETPTPRTVLQLTPHDGRQLQHVARRILHSAPYGTYRLYNADLPPTHTYLYEHDLFPLAYLRATPTHDTIHWHLLDAADWPDYELPDFQHTRLTVHPRTTQLLPAYADPLDHIQLKHQGEAITLTGREPDQLHALVHTLRQLDPDFLHTPDGDTWTLRYLWRRAHLHHMDDQLILGREPIPLRWPSTPGTSFVSYGKIQYRPTSMPLHGRIHLDESHAFLLDSTGLQGLCEVARLCRIPLHTALRASIGKCMSSLQCYLAHRQGVLVPWHPLRSEAPKPAHHLFTGDRGGFIFEPRLGLHPNVGEIDFTSLYPQLMHDHNLSGETVPCPHTPSHSSTTPGDTRTEQSTLSCTHLAGLVPQALRLLLAKRHYYTHLKHDTTNPTELLRYDGRQAALKWILVCCFGYLGYRNAKFGRIDAHIAVCAQDRRVLLAAMRLAEAHGFTVLHGIVDCLWVQKPYATAEEYTALAERTEQETGFPTSFEGVYAWIAFLPSRQHPRTPVLNRYFGVFTDGRVKMRGIETRRHDTPQFLSHIQEDLLQQLAQAPSLHHLRQHTLPHILQRISHYAQQLRTHQVPAHDLLLHHTLSHDPHHYRQHTHAHLAALQLHQHGHTVHAGETVSYLVTAATHSRPLHRVCAAPLLPTHPTYDIAYYLTLLHRTLHTLLQPFGVTEAQIHALMTQTTTSSALTAATATVGVK